MAFGRLREADFYLTRNRSIWQAAVRVAGRGATPDERTVLADLDDRGELDQVGGTAYLTGLLLSLPDAVVNDERLGAYIEIIRDRARRRRAVAAGEAMARDALAAGASGTEVISRARAKIDEAEGVDLPRGGAWRTVASIMADLGAEIDGRGHQSRAEPVTYGLPLLDKMCPPEPGQVYLVGARPGVGKTAFLLQTANRMAIDHNEPCAFLSLEMTARELGMRLVSLRTGVPHYRIRAGTPSADDWVKIVRAMREITDSSLVIDDTPALPLTEITARAKLLYHKEPFRLLLIDYLGLVAFSGTLDRADLEISAITAGLVALAKELSIPIIVAAQLNRTPSREKRKPMLSDLREGGGQEQDAYGVLFLHREPREGSPSLLADHGCIIVAKNRGGETGEIKVNFDGPRMLFTEHTDRPEEREWSK